MGTTVAAPMTAGATAASGTSGNLQLLSQQFGIPVVRLLGRTIDPRVLQLIPRETAQAFQMVAYEVLQTPNGRQTVRLAVADPHVLEQEAPPVVTELHTRGGYGITISLAAAADIADVLRRYPLSDQSSDNPSAAPARLPAAAVEPQRKPAPATAVPTVDLRKRTIPRVILLRIPEETAKRYRIIAFDSLNAGRTIHVAVEDPDRPDVKEFLHFLATTDHDVHVSQASRASIDHGLTLYQRGGETPSLLSVVKETHPKPADNRPLTKPPTVVPAQPTIAEKNRKLVAPRPPVPGQMPSAAGPKSPPPPAVPSVVTVSAGSLPDLRVPAPAGSPLIPASVDVERDLTALVGQPITNLRALQEVVGTGFIPKIVGAVLLLAADMGASDVHIQAEESDVLIRYRVDGILQDMLRIPQTLLAPIVSRIKILATMKIDESRIPQDGRFEVQAGDRVIDLRISTYPTVRGEKVVLRLLDKSTGLFQFADLGLVDSRLTRLQTQIARPYGVVLATGPTGSGKTTTLYAILQTIARSEVNVVTLEDPVEYEIAGINQAQIKPKIGFGFAEGLRSILRQDPNIIMVGEIRDRETAGMMVHAALTGHLVLSTLHTNNAAGALPRLMNMGVEPFLITSALNAVVAQRLVRKLCDQCRKPWKIPAEVDEDIRRRLEIGNHAELTPAVKDGLRLFKAHGCAACHDGFKGRIGIFEVLVMSDRIEELAVKKVPASELEAAAIDEGMVTMEQDGILKAVQGLTTLDEVFRVTQTD
ncbi:Flp pilus assembly complex ATPase component TadA [Candidatus Berkelbacteria bacterium]|nr:Flp pilus assembly complex ATPase component TadA [Candidatus Berkelbacteria bacterium]